MAFYVLTHNFGERPPAKIETPEMVMREPIASPQQSAQICGRKYEKLHVMHVRPGIFHSDLVKFNMEYVFWASAQYRALPRKFFRYTLGPCPFCIDKIFGRSPY